MKTFLFLALALPIFISCSKSETGFTPEVSNGTMSAIIDGKSWSAKLVDGIGPEAITESGTDPIVDFYGYDKTYMGTLTFSIYKTELVAGKTIAIKEFTIPTLSERRNIADYIISDDNNNLIKAYHSTSGTMKITSISATNIKGTFSFEAYNEANASDKISVKDGKFDVPLR
jgi:hypothetical protein